MVKTAQTSLPTFGSSAAILSLILIAVFGALVAKAITERREASGEVVIELYQRD
jgi:hypothetical protein